MTLRVAIAYNFNDRDWFGGKNYFTSLFKAVERAASPGALQWLFVTGERTETTLPSEFPDLEVIKTPLMDKPHLGWLARQADLRLLDTDRLLARLLNKHGADVLSHSGQLGEQTKIKTLPWLYDFQFMHLPQYWQAKHIRWAEQRYKAACCNANGVIVSSYSALADLTEFAPQCKALKHVLQFVSNPVDIPNLEEKSVLQEKYALPEAYFHLPNQFWKNKNHQLAIDALCLLENRGVRAYIVCTGHTFDGRLPEYFNELMAYCEKRGVKDRFLVLGVVPFAHTQSIMAHAKAVINPSRFEGWSTTVEEAKTLHKKLLLSDISVHREQSPGLGRYFDVDSPEQLSTLMESCLNEPSEAADEDLIAADYDRRLKSFGSSYLEILNKTVSKNAGFRGF